MATLSTPFFFIFCKTDSGGRSASGAADNVVGGTVNWAVGGGVSWVVDGVVSDNAGVSATTNDNKQLYENVLETEPQERPHSPLCAHLHILNNRRRNPNMQPCTLFLYRFKGIPFR